MSSLEPDQCNTKEFCIQKALNAYNSKQYSNILKATHTFAIPYSTMKNHVSGKISQTKTQKLVQNLSNTKKKNINTMDYTFYNYWIFCFSKIDTGNG